MALSQHHLHGISLEANSMVTWTI